MNAGPRIRSALFAGIACVLTLGSCGDEAIAPDANGGGANGPAQNSVLEWETATSRAGRYKVSWRPVPGAVPLNELFEISVRVENAADGAPILNAGVHVIAEMPEHGHGMNREPRSTEEGDGLYRVRGMLMHMTGRWVLSIDVVVESVSESTDFEVVLE